MWLPVLLLLLSVLLRFVALLSVLRGLDLLQRRLDQRVVRVDPRQRSEHRVDERRVVEVAARRSCAASRRRSHRGLRRRRRRRRPSRRRVPRGWCRRLHGHLERHLHLIVDAGRILRIHGRRLRGVLHRHGQRLLKQRLLLVLETVHRRGRLAAHRSGGRGGWVGGRGGCGVRAGSRRGGRRAGRAVDVHRGVWGTGCRVVSRGTRRGLALLPRTLLLHRDAQGHRELGVHVRVHAAEVAAAGRCRAAGSRRISGRVAPVAAAAAAVAHALVEHG
mmetsp:Transcript_28489/g.58413  ORF Transcript_28489/g.58413 Transcript_28489/m.58413 type:complete len:275 (-) Transcript_28489:576-1400(-)